MADQELNHELESRLQLQWRGERMRGQEASSLKRQFLPGPFVARPQWCGGSEDQEDWLASSQSWRLPAISSLLHGELGEEARNLCPTRLIGGSKPGRPEGRKGEGLVGGENPASIASSHCSILSSWINNPESWVKDPLKKREDPGLTLWGELNRGSA
ncbi:hypothetical protein CRENBAI_006664 [Crenichthys baileyi]|uniref:Uncharacterized protein n=1 Tax=Crenichthys baileyi TaxID=28760 RepID=A0AAV9R2Z8_9TELE